MRLRTGMQLLMVCILLSTIGPTVVQAQNADAEDCGRAGSTLDIASCYKQKYEKADSVLNAVYGDIMTDLEKQKEEAEGDYKTIMSKKIETLRTAERAWIDYREKHCEAVVASYGKGSLVTVAAVSCRFRMTERRIQALRDTYYE